MLNPADKSINRRGIRRGALRLSPVCLAVSSAIYGQNGGQSADADPEPLEEVVVTAREFFRPTVASSATKFDLPIVETPQSISVISSDMIEVFAPQDRNNLQKYVAGTYSLSDEAGSLDLFGDGLAVRGFGIDFDNGYKLNGFSTLGAFRPDMAAVERVEFVKGPTAIVYGINSYGGVVNTVTKRPQAEPETRIGLGVGSFDFRRIELDSTGPLGSGDALSYRLVGAYQERKYAQRGSDAERRTVMPALAWKASDQLDVNLTGFFSNEDLVPCNSYTLTTDASGNPAVPADTSRKVCTVALDATEQKVQHRQGIVDFRYRFDGDTYLQGQAGWSKTKMRWTSVYLYNFLGPAVPNVYVYGNSQRNDLETYDVELDFGGKFEAFGRQHEFLVAGEFRSLERDIPTYQYVYFGYANAFDPDFSVFDFSDPSALHQVDGYQRNDRTTLGLSGHVLLHATERLKFLAGARWTQAKLKIAEADFIGGGVDPGAGPYSLTSDFTVSRVTPRLGAVFSILPKLNVFASYSPGFIPQFGITRNLETIDPETGTQYEAGIKGEFLGGALGGALSYYRIDRKDVQVADPENTLDENFVIKGRKQRHEGVELELIGQVARGLNVVATYAHQDAEVTENLSNPLFVGRDVQRVPDQVASLYVNYQFLEGPLRGFSLGGGASYSGDYYQREDDFRFRFDSQNSVDLIFAYTGIPRLGLRLLIDNVTDEDAFNGPRSCRFSCLARKEPRSARFLVSYRF